MEATGPDLFSRARGEYLEMPGLSLTLDQAQRLWALDRGTCSRLMSVLVQAGFLRQRRDGAYVRRRSGREPQFETHPNGG